MNNVILFRKLDKTEETEKEFLAAQAHFTVSVSRNAEVCKGVLVVGRYVVLPFYREVETDLGMVGSRLINTFQQHQYIADLQNWYKDLEGMTPRTWFRMEDVPDDIGAVVVKGETNSKKHLWDTHMFARDKTEAIKIMMRLWDDGFLSSQRIYIREFVPLRKFFTGLHGLPITEEYRFFICNGEVLSGGYYWSSHAEDALEFQVSPQEVPLSFLNDIISRVGNKALFYVVDVARTVKGKWIVVELNDGQMSGISENDPNILYKNLRATLDRGEISLVG